MKILLSNDDGADAPGLAALARTLAGHFEITVVAPEENQSGASNSLSLRRTLRVRKNDGGFYCVDGTPADCVHLAVAGMLDFRPDLVIAGINHGANLGDDVLYSGTVAAAIEGRFLGLPAIAVSLAVDVGDDDALSPHINQPADATRNHYDTAAEVALRLLRNLRALPRDTILNVNVPDLPMGEIAGMRATRLGARHPSQPAIELHADGANKKAGVREYQIGAIGDSADAGPGTDFDAVGRGAVSVTPLQIDMTRHGSVENIADWLGGINNEK
ncbi:MAG: 5'/3'-nucleotidase SurE [Gammaproteobacteria bacterium]|nr:5'/3'-nucleotidase SurE [Gammaproteobacteria bacterium]